LTPSTGYSARQKIQCCCRYGGLTAAREEIYVLTKTTVQFWVLYEKLTGYCRDKLD